MSWRDEAGEADQSGDDKNGGVGYVALQGAGEGETLSYLVFES